MYLTGFIWEQTMLKIASIRLITQGSNTKTHHYMIRDRFSR